MHLQLCEYMYLLNSRMLAYMFILTDYKSDKYESIMTHNYNMMKTTTKLNMFTRTLKDSLTLSLI